MDVRHLRYFLAVAAEGSLTQAADLLYMTQPALSRQIHQLEDELGTQLFDRTPRGVAITPAGTALQAHATQILRLMDSTRDVTATALPAREIVTVGLATGLPGKWLRSLLSPLLSGESRFDLRIVDSGSTQLLNLVQEGGIDLAIVHQDPPARLRRAKLLEKPFGIALRPGHLLGDGRQARMDELSGLRVLAHAREQVPSEYDRILANSYEAQAHPDWQFSRFTENAELCVETTDSIGVIVNESTAARLVPTWEWIQLTDPGVSQLTWLAWPLRTRTAVAQAVDSLLRHQESLVFVESSPDT